MRKILIGLLFLIGWSVQAQIVPASQVQISQFGRLKKLTVKPATPAIGFGNWFNLNDSLHFENPVKDWNLGKIAYTDTLGFYLLKSDTAYFLHTSDLQSLQDSLASITPTYFAKQLASTGENDIKITFPLTITTKVFYNGSIIENSRWSKIGSDTIHLLLDTMIYDALIIHN